MRSELLKIFRKILCKDEVVNRIQDSLIAVLNPALKIPFLDGAQLVNLSITTSAQKFSHNLNRQPSGWLITDNQANSVIYRSAWTSTTITLTGSANTTASLWVW